MSKGIKFRFTHKELSILLKSSDVLVVEFIKSKLEQREKVILDQQKAVLKKQNKLQDTLARKSEELREIAKKFRQDLVDNKTKEEKLFEVYLKINNIKYEFQKVVYNKKSFYIVDFYLPEFNLVVEIDGGYHIPWKQQIKDRNRTKDLISIGFKFVKRVRNEEVEKKGDIIVKKIPLEYTKIKPIK